MSNGQAAPSTPVLTITDGQARVCLNRPDQHNRLEPADLEALVEIFDRVAADDACRVLIITGKGRSFSSGFHIGALADSKSGSQDYDPNAFERMVNRLEDLRVPTIAALNGGVYGGATDMALACDFRIGVEGMRMFMPAAKLGIVYYEGGLRRYVTRLGLDNAKRLFLTAAATEAEDLLRMGFVTELVSPDKLDETVDALAMQIVGNAPMAVAALKAALNNVAAGNLDPEAHAAERTRCASSQDHREAVAAWQEKRQPVFVGR
ncbi:MAG: enoyl-CoA hydratase/isomerase family protein [Hyphomicrobiaceae bacterium]